MSASAKLLAAADCVELIPPAGGKLGGFGCRFEPLVGVLDRLFARVLLLQKGATRVLWVSCDLLGFSTIYDRNFREQLARATSIPVQNILISCTHTHSAPVAMPARGPSGISDVRWLRAAVFARVAECAAALQRQVKPVAQISMGSETVSGFGYNRQDAAAPIDERVLSASLVGEDGKAIATIVNYALHPVVIGEHNLKCSGDYPGYVCTSIESQLGGMAMFIQGSCGDVDPILYRDSGRNAGTVTHIRQMGERIAAAAMASLRHVEAAPSDLVIQSCHIAVPLDPPPGAEELSELKAQFLKDRGDLRMIPTDGVGRGAMYQLAWAEELESTMTRGTVPDSVSAEVTAVRIGPIHVITFPFEIYSQIGLELRQQLAPRQVMIAAYTHGLIGYVVTTAAKKLGGYGAGFSHRYFPELLTAIGVGADELLIQHGVSLVRSVDH